MEESILNTIKPLLNIEPDDESFDSELIPLINTNISTLVSLGVGPKDGFEIADSSASWKDFIGNNKLLAGVKSYIYIKTRLVFDPPTSAAVITSLTEEANRLEFRLPVAVETP